MYACMRTCGLWHSIDACSTCTVLYAVHDDAITKNRRIHNFLRTDTIMTGSRQQVCVRLTRP